MIRKLFPNHTQKTALRVVAVALAVALPALSAAASSYSQSSGTVSKSGQAYTANATDESGVLVTGGTFTLSDSSVSTTGDTSSADNSSFLGQNAGVLAKSGGTIHLSTCTIDTEGRGANGVFAYGTGVVSVANSTIYCYAQLAHGIMASGGGTVTADSVNITTQGANSAAIATDRGGGTITVTGGTMTTSGQDSPGLYSTGTISVTGATISATNSEASVTEGFNTVTLTNTNLSGGQSNYGGVLLMQSMSGDSQVGTATFTMTGGSLTAPTGALFFVTNTKAAVTLSGVQTSVASGTLVNACGTSRWGTTGSNGGTLTFAANGQALAGDIVVDAISAVDATLQNGSTLTGAVDSANTGKSVALALDASSSWTVTADSHVGSLGDAAAISGHAVANITGNGHVVYYDPSANAYLNGLTYTLVNGGYLAPEGTTPGEGEGEGEGEAEFGFTNTPYGGWYVEGQSVSLSVAVQNATGAVTYQWKKNGASIQGATESTLTMDSVTTEDSGRYACQAADAGKSIIESDNALVSVFPEGALPGANGFALAVTAAACLGIGLVAVRRQSLEKRDGLCGDIDTRG